MPKKMLKQILFNLENPNPVSVRHIMNTYGEVCVITREENKLLSKAGLNNKMPNGWHVGGNIFARYEAIGVQVWENDRQW